MMSKGKETNPAKVETTPSSFPSGDYSYVLEIVMGMQLTMGKLSEAVDSLKAESKRHDDKLDSIGKDVHAAKVVVSVIGALIVLAFGFLGWIGHEALQYLSSHPVK
jgi:ABC-type nickel/cobalt efflux system permease component RcnA